MCVWLLKKEEPQISYFTHMNGISDFYIYKTDLISKRIHYFVSFLRN